MSETANDFVVRDSGERQDFETGARRDSQEDKPRLSLVSPWALVRIAWVYTRGAKKYGEHNWQKGMPYSRYLDSAERHLIAWKQGEKTEDHLAMACWNLMAIMHHEEQGPEGLDDVHGSFDETPIPQLLTKIPLLPIQRVIV